MVPEKSHGGGEDADSNDAADDGDGALAPIVAGKLIKSVFILTWEILLLRLVALVDHF